jgi:hypothetical protein
MSFLSSNHAEYLTARITNEGRKAIAKGTFNIEFFQIGDSEFDYDTIFSGLTGTTGQQKVFAPFDNESGVKYPYSLGSDTLTSTTYGTPISNSSTTTLRNEMGSAGFTSQYDLFGTSTKSLTPITGSTFIETYSGTTIESSIGVVAYSALTGNNTITFTKKSGVIFNQLDFITLVFSTFPTGYTLNNLDEKIVKNYTPSGKTNGMVYKVLSQTGTTTGTTHTFLLDRSTPNLSSLSGNAQIVSNTYTNETPTDDVFNPIDYRGQLNSWTLNTVWTDTPIGWTNDDESLSGYTSNQYVSTKQLLGYTKSGQTFTNFTGGAITGVTSTSIGTTFKNSFGDLIEVKSSEQRCVAVIHYSELGDIVKNPERFFKYDDYIGHCTLSGETPTGQDSVCDITIVNDRTDDGISDTEYFEVFIPFILYHRSTGTTLGALFTMETRDYYIKSTINEKHQIKFRYLLDEVGTKVGKVFVNNKIIVFDDQELVAVLDYRSNRKYTLPSPKVYATPTNSTALNSMLTGTTGQTVWLTYMLEYTGDTKLNSLPCNNFNSVRLVNNTPSNISFKFSDGALTEFDFLMTGATLVTEGFVANKFTVLVQIVNSATGTPISNEWRKIDLTSEVGGNGVTLLNKTGFTGTTFTITKTQYDAASLNKFDLEDHMSGVTTDYLWNTTGSTTQPQFGDEQPFPGSIRLVRATDIEEMNMLINLPSTQFLTSQNPTYPTTGTTPTYITEVALLDSLKEPLVIAKTSTPIKRTGTQVFAIKLDF